ncbi:MAG: response regulator [Anaerolineales bacterium]|nr:response regulator [Anaerolineales bacterium]
MPLILIADANESFAARMADELKRTGGYQVTVAGNGPDALKQCAALKPQLAVLDGELPEGEPAELIPLLRASVPDLPVVVMPVSTEQLPPNVTVQGTLFKPFFFPDLMEMIQPLLGPAASPTSQPCSTVTGRPPPSSALQGRLSAGGLNPANRPATMTPGDNVRRAIESQLENLSRALHDETVLLAQGGRVLLSVPRLSATASAALSGVVAKAWSATDAPPEVLRFEGTGESNHYLLYSLLVAGDVTLSVALNSRIPLPIIRRVTRQAAGEIAKLINTDAAPSTPE